MYAVSYLNIVTLQHYKEWETKTRVIRVHKRTLNTVSHDEQRIRRDLNEMLFLEDILKFNFLKKTGIGVWNLFLLNNPMYH